MPRTTPSRIPGGSNVLVIVMSLATTAILPGSKVYLVYFAFISYTLLHAQTRRGPRPAHLDPAIAAATAALTRPGGHRGRRDRPRRRGRAGGADDEGRRRPAGLLLGHGAVPVRLQQGRPGGPHARRRGRRDHASGTAG